MSQQRKTTDEELLARSAELREQLDEHVDALAAVTVELRWVARLDCPDKQDRSPGD